MVKLIVAAGVLFAIGCTVLYFVSDHQRFVAFTADRDAWHGRCDVYRHVSFSNPKAAVCNAELQALTAYATQQGWIGNR